MTTGLLRGLAPGFRAGRRAGITSVCSAHPAVIAAALALGRVQGKVVLIEATCNQVTQFGGYTGMTPVDFRRFVEGIAADEGFDLSQLLLGGDHLGPNPWKDRPAGIAMDYACAMVADYAAAGFAKFHLDASMPCADDPVPLPNAVIAERASRLAAVAEQHATTAAPVYIIGTEVPIPGGAAEAVDHLVVTSADAARETVEIHRKAFATQGIRAAFDRVIGVVVQPGVEFGNETVVAYTPRAARRLVAALDDLPLIFEAHSTDYQTPDALAALVRDGFAILKVGPGLTFAWRETLYGLDHIADHLFPARAETMHATMERLMLANPKHWASHHLGTPADQKLQRHFSYSDRIRYYWDNPVANRAVAELLAMFGNTRLPEPLIAQYLGRAYGDVTAGLIQPTAAVLLQAAVTRVLASYSAACGDLQTV